MHTQKQRKNNRIRIEELRERSVRFVVVVMMSMFKCFSCRVRKTVIGLSSIRFRIVCLLCVNSNYCIVYGKIRRESVVVVRRMLEKLFWFNCQNAKGQTNIPFSLFWTFHSVLVFDNSTHKHSHNNTFVRFFVRALAVLCTWVDDHKQIQPGHKRTHRQPKRYYI